MSQLELKRLVTWLDGLTLGERRQAMGRIRAILSLIGNEDDAHQIRSMDDEAFQLVFDDQHLRNVEASAEFSTEELREFRADDDQRTLRAIERLQDPSLTIPSVLEEEFGYYDKPLEQRIRRAAEQRETPLPKRSKGRPKGSKNRTSKEQMEHK